MAKKSRKSTDYAGLLRETRRYIAKDEKLIEDSAKTTSAV
jgi:hypothetical protein